MIPLVSVLMPVYNAAQHVGESIASVLRQSMPDFELVVVDDGSTDGSMAIVRSFDDPRIRIVAHDGNRGLAAARNTAVASARGRFLAWLDADDLSHELRLEKQVAVLERRPEVGLCGTWVRTFGGVEGDEWRYPTDSRMLRVHMLFWDPFATSSVMLRADLGSRMDLRFDEAFPPAEDYELWERVVRVTESVNIPELLTFYRIHANQTSPAMGARQRESVARIQLRQLRRLGLRPTDDELALHRQIGVGPAPASGAWAECAHRWLLGLRDANRSSGAYPPAPFDRVLFHEWLRVCVTAWQPGLSSFSRFLSSPLVPVPLALSRPALGFLRRCLL